MRMLGISCSPREGGNTEILITEALSGAQRAGAGNTEFVSLAGKNISPYDACEAYSKMGIGRRGYTEKICSSLREKLEINIFFGLMELCCLRKKQKMSVNWRN